MNYLLWNNFKNLDTFKRKLLIDRVYKSKRFETQNKNLQTLETWRHYVLERGGKETDFPCVGKYVKNVNLIYFLRGN